MYSPLVERALEVLPIQRGYHDIWGNFQQPTEEGLQAILRALRFESDSSGLEQLNAWKVRTDAEVLAPVVVLRGAERLITTRYPRKTTWSLQFESGEEFSGTSDGGRITLPERLSEGYYNLRVSLTGAELSSKIIVCPEQAHLSLERKCWGLSTQLYSIASRESEGIGDFRDLENLCRWVKTRGGAFVGLNPLHLLFPDDPLGYSPYSPSSRRALNALYVHLESLPEFSSEDLRIREALRQRSSPFLNYPEITSAKFEILRRCYERLKSSQNERHVAFRKFVESVDEHTRTAALHAALDKAQRGENPSSWGWPVWPEELQQVHSAAVKRFQSEKPEEIEFFLYCQWVSRSQLQEVTERSPLDLGLYLDLAVGVNPAGAEVWEDPELFSLQASAGAPPDLLNVHGQVWGLAPYIPWELRKRAYEPFIQTLRFNMQFSGALRIDHIMSLQRLFWVPVGMSGREGIYVHYPLRDLMGIVALESKRNSCTVIGEDLGTVSDDIRSEMNRSNVLSYKVLFFMKHYESDGSFLRPDEYPANALVATSTHDLPTLQGYWNSQDLAVRQPLGLFSENCTYEGETEGRLKDKAMLQKALQDDGLSADENELVSSAHQFLARTPCKIQTIQIEDLIGEIHQANLPGTVIEHPNWRRRLSRSLESILLDETLARLLTVISETRAK